MGFRLIRQKDSMQCGVASLAMICRYYGRVYSTKYIEQYCHPTNEGISLKGLMDGARELGFIPTAIKTGIHDLCRCPLPLILHWDQKHFVVLYRTGGDGEGTEKVPL